jgi:hypothetical protein
MFITTRITVSMITGAILEHEGFEYSGPVELACGATSQQKGIEASEASYYSTLTSQATAEFGDASAVFSDLTSAFAPIVAAGPNQQGFSAAELQNLNSTAVTTGGEAASNAAQATRQAEAAGSGNSTLPSGATAQINATVAGQAATNVSNNLNQIEEQNYAVGRQNFDQASAVLSSAPGVFGTSNSGAGTAVGGGEAAGNTANQIAQENNSWVNAVTGALGGVAGNVATGGFKNLGSGAGFFGQNAPAPGG